MGGVRPGDLVEDMHLQPWPLQFKALVWKVL